MKNKIERILFLYPSSCQESEENKILTLNLLFYFPYFSGFLLIDFFPKYNIIHAELQLQIMYIIHHLKIRNIYKYIQRIKHTAMLNEPWIIIKVNWIQLKWTELTDIVPPMLPILMSHSWHAYCSSSSVHHTWLLSHKLWLLFFKNKISSSFYFYLVLY